MFLQIRRWRCSQWPFFQKRSFKQCKVCCRPTIKCSKLFVTNVLFLKLKFFLTLHLPNAATQCPCFLSSAPSSSWSHSQCAIRVILLRPSGYCVYRRFNYPVVRSRVLLEFLLGPQQVKKIPPSPPFFLNPCCIVVLYCCICWCTLYFFKLHMCYCTVLIYIVANMPIQRLDTD